MPFVEQLHQRGIYASIFGLLFSFELCLKELMVNMQVLQNNITCYFLLNYAQKNESCKDHRTTRQLAIFFWIMPFIAASNTGIIRSRTCYFLLNYAGLGYWVLEPKTKEALLLFSFELCKRLYGSLWTYISPSTCYFLLNYAEKVCVGNSSHKQPVNLLFSFELCYQLSLPA